MRFKYYLRGVGIGIIFTAIVLSVAHKEEVKKLTMTESKIVEEAKKLGMMTKAEVEEMTKPTPDPSPESTLDPSPEPTSSPEPSSSPTPSPTPEPTKEPTPSPDPTETPEPEYVTVNITKGMGSDAVAKAMQDKGLVSNAEEFDKYLMDNGYASFIWVGTYKIKKGSTYLEIAKKIAEQ